MSILAVLFVLAQTTVLAAPAAPAPAPGRPTSQQVIDAAPAASWSAISDDDLMVIDFTNGRRTIVWLAPEFAPVHVANIRRIARAGWWNDATVYRVQDNYVTQWGDATEHKAPAAGIDLHPPAEYDWAPHPAVRNPWTDAYARTTGFTRSGWAVAGDGRRQWLPHCYGMVGVARDLAPDTGTGGDLYTVIGHAPRHLDRNIAVVGRIVEGMDAMSALPRGTGGGLGLYEDAAMRVPIRRVTIASDLPAAERPHFEYFRPDAAAFPRYLEVRANRRPPFFTVPAGAADLCNLPVPVRRVRG